MQSCRSFFDIFHEGAAQEQILKSKWWWGVCNETKPMPIHAGSCVQVFVCMCVVLHLSSSLGEERQAKEMTWELNLHHSHCLPSRNGMRTFIWPVMAKYSQHWWFIQEDILDNELHDLCKLGKGCFTRGHHISIGCVMKSYVVAMRSTMMWLHAIDVMGCRR